MTFFSENAKAFQAYKAKSKAKSVSAAKFKNCVHEPLLKGEGNQRISDIIPPPELHIHLGLTNKHARELNEAWGDDQFYQWCFKNNIKVENFFTNEMNGNSCKEVLEAQDSLEAELIGSGRSDLLLYVESMRAFNKVRKSCFGMDLEESFEEDIAAFKEAYVKVGLSVTTKAHILFEHVADFCKKHGKGLGHFSEQAR